MSQDPYPSERSSSGNREYPYDGGAFGRQGDGPYQSSQPYQQGMYQQGMYPQGTYRSYQNLEGQKAAQLSLILGIVGFFVAGIILGPLAIWQAKKAERLGVPATAGKVVGWVVTALYGIALLLSIVLGVLVVVGLSTAATYRG